MPISSVWKLPEEEFLKIIEGCTTTMEASLKMGVSKAVVDMRLDVLGSSESTKNLVDWKPNVAKYKRISIDDLSYMVAHATTWTSICKDLGYAGVSCIGKGLKQYLITNGIDISHLPKDRGWNRGKKHPCKKYQLSDILTINSKYKGSLQNYLLNAGLIQEKCAECGIGPIWNGKRFTMDLDHINGNHTDNRIENLRMLCPICHRQTETYGSKNTAYLTKDEKKLRLLRKLPKKKPCLICGVDIALNSKHCRKCNGTLKKTLREKEIQLKKALPGIGNRSRKVVRPPLQEILASVKKIGYVATGRKYGVTDNAIRKWIINYRAKVPRGHNKDSPIKKEDYPRILWKKEDRPSLAQLLKGVSDTGYFATAKKYGVVDNTIRYWIREQGGEPPKVSVEPDTVFVEKEFQGLKYIVKRQAVDGEVPTASTTKKSPTKKGKHVRPPIDVLLKEVIQGTYTAVAEKYQVSIKCIANWITDYGYEPPYKGRLNSAEKKNIVITKRKIVAIKKPTVAG